MIDTQTDIHTHTHTHTYTISRQWHIHTDTGNDNTRRPKLASGKNQSLSSSLTPMHPLGTMRWWLQMHLLIGIRKDKDKNWWFMNISICKKAISPLLMHVLMLTKGRHFIACLQELCLFCHHIYMVVMSWHHGTVPQMVYGLITEIWWILLL